MKVEWIKRKSIRSLGSKTKSQEQKSMEIKVTIRKIHKEERA